MDMIPQTTENQDKFKNFTKSHLIFFFKSKALILLIKHRNTNHNMNFVSKNINQFANL